MTHLSTHNALFSDLTAQLPNVHVDDCHRYGGATTTRLWTPIDNYNHTWYEGCVNRERMGPTVDFNRENRVSERWCECRCECR